MMKRAKLLLAVGLCLLVPGRVALCEEGWKLVMHKNGVDAYSRHVEGSAFMEVRAVTVIPASLDVLAQVLRDVPNHKKWRPFCKLSSVVRQPDPFTMIVYDVESMPWPLTDRDEVLRCEIIVDKEKARGVGRLTPAEDPDAPVRKDRVRVTDFYAHYILQYLGKDRTGLVFTTRVNPGGRLPAFLVNGFSKYYAYSQLLALKKSVKDPYYIEQAKKSLDRQIIEKALADKSQRKAVFFAILGEFIKDKGFIEMIVSDAQLFNETFQGGLESGDMGEILLYGWGSHKAKKQATASLLKEYLKLRTKDQGLVQKITTDDALLDAIVTGTHCSGKSARDIIASYLGTLAKAP